MRTRPVNLSQIPASGVLHTALHPLRAAILTKLEGSTSQSPVELTELYRLGSEVGVRTVLAALYRDGYVQTVLIAKRGIERSLWWRVGNVPLQTDRYGIGGKQ